MSINFFIALSSNPFSLPLSPHHSPLHCRCDVIAAGVLNAAKNIGMKKPIIIRLKGTNVKEAKKLIEVSA